MNVSPALARWIPDPEGAESRKLLIGQVVSRNQQWYAAFTTALLSSQRKLRFAVWTLINLWSEIQGHPPGICFCSSIHRHELKLKPDFGQIRLQGDAKEDFKSL